MSRRLFAVGTLAVLWLTGCGGSDAGRADVTADTSGRPTIVVSTTILADIVERIAGDQVAIDTLMPSGADPHHFSASARQAAAMETADLVVVNGGGFEEGMARLIDTVRDDGVNVFAVTDHVELLRESGAAGAADPHVWTDPQRMATAADALGQAIAELDGIDGAAIAASTTRTVDDLIALDREIAAEVATIEPSRRVLVTNHEAFNYYADRYGFTIVGTVIPSLTTNAEPSARDIEDLADVVRENQVPAVFAETTSSTALASALAREVGDIDGRPVVVVELYAESLGAPGSGADTYDSMLREDTKRIVAALNSGTDS